MQKQLQYGLQDSFKKQGLWWLPNEPEDEVAGTLSFDPDSGAHLDLVGSFGDWHQSDRLSYIDIIQGLTADGIECTLCNNHIISDTVSFPGIPHQEFKSRHLILGCLFDNEGEQIFTSFKVNFEYLEEWLDRIPYDFDAEIGERKFEYHLVWPSRIYLKSFLQQLAGEITISNTLYTTEKSSKIVHFEQDAYIKFMPQEPQHLIKYMTLFRDLQHLLTLLMGENTFPKKIQATVHREKKQTNVEWPVSIYYRLPTSFVPKSLYQHEMLVTFSAISQQFPNFIDKWLGNADQLRPVYDLFFSALYKTDMYIENRFLNVVNALESYHRGMEGGRYVADEEYNKYYDVLVQAIPKSTPHPLRDALKGRLIYGNEFSLAKRLKNIFAELNKELAELVTNDATQFVRQVVDTRNYLIHHDNRLKGKSLNSEDMFHIYQRLRILLTILLLRSLDIEDSNIEKIIASNRRIQPWDD